MNEVFPKKFMQALNRMYSMSRLAKKIAYQKMHLSSYVTQPYAKLPDDMKEVEILDLASRKKLVEEEDVFKQRSFDISKQKKDPEWKKLESKTKSSAGILQFMIEEEAQINVFKMSPNRYIGTFNLILGYLGSISKQIDFLKSVTSENWATKFLADNFQNLMKKREINWSNYQLSAFKKVQRSLEKKANFLYSMYLINEASVKLKILGDEKIKYMKELLSDGKLLRARKKKLVSLQKKKPEAEDKRLQNQIKENQEQKKQLEENYLHKRDNLRADLNYHLSSYLKSTAKKDKVTGKDLEIIRLRSDYKSYKAKKYTDMDMGKFFTKENLGVTLSRAVAQKYDLLVEAHF